MSRPGILTGVLLLGALSAVSVWADPPVGITGEKWVDPPGQEQPPELSPDASQEERLKTVVNLAFTNADLKSVLSSLAKIYGLNIVADESVSGTVTIALRDVTLEEGLRQLLKLNGLGFTVSGQIIEVVRLELKRSAGLIPVNYINLDTALEFVQKLASEDAVLKVDKVSNGILVSDYINRIEEMRALIKEIDQQPQQVFIESKLMDITHTDLDNLGIQLSSVGLTVPIKMSGGDPLSIASGALNLAGPSADLSGDELQFTVSRADDTVTATLDALIRDRRVKVIANPTVLTVNNAEARIIIGEKFPIREQTQTTTGTLETTRFVDVGTALRVTPRINPGGSIQLHIHPEVSSVSDTLDEGPRITTREADTTVVVKDGQPVIIGGLLQHDETFIKGRIPGLSHIPFLGLLFQNRSKSYAQKELVIVITPYIVPNNPSSPGPFTETHETGGRLDAMEMFNHAKALEEGISLKARQMSPVLRALQAADIYQRVVDRFPTHPYAMESLWRIGRISRQELYDLNKAETAYRRLLTQFPASRYANGAKRELKEISWQKEQIEKRGLRISARAEAASGAPQKNFGSR
ncbi:MAG: secretin and TonB N-terminal domain-containing protein [Candidatus Omnitrophica bacterium]|nr:secretin and TonB N-terminal domain-containing protein [Candidatus Omnitrophota bacterium]